MLFAHQCCSNYFNSNPWNHEDDVHACLKLIIVDLAIFGSQIKRACEFHHSEIYIGKDQTSSSSTASNFHILRPLVGRGAASRGMGVTPGGRGSALGGRGAALRGMGGTPGGRGAASGGRGTVSGDGGGIYAMPFGTATNAALTTQQANDQYYEDAFYYC
eukprot:3186294-Rhodomonas_salina.1